MTPKLCLIDIETSPLLGYAWQMYDTNILALKEPVKVLSCAWKWLHEDKVRVKGLIDYKDYVPGVVNDKSLVADVWNVLDEADIVIAHNGDAFDIKVLNARFVANGLNAPSDYKTIDTLKVAKKYFRFNNNTLNELGSYLDEGRKAATGGFGTWLACMEGDPAAWKRMKLYNAKDIELLERIYLRLRPFIGNHPNLNVIAPVKTTKFVCPTCQSQDTVKRGYSITKMGRYQRFQCNNCGSWGSGGYENQKAISVFKDEDV